MTLKNRRELEKLANKVMDKLADAVLSVAVDNINDPGSDGRTIADRGTLARSGNVERQFLKKKVIFDAPHAEVTELGRGPSDKLPPIEEIAGWVHRKLGMPLQSVERVDKTDKFGKKRSVIVILPKETAAVVWAIATHIKRHGFQGRFYLQRAKDSVIGSKKNISEFID